MNIGLAARRRTILIVDADAHARAGLRKALEAAAFSVGEAASAAEGERTVRRIRPDAILVDPHVDDGVPGPALPERLRAGGFAAPCYLISTAGAALIGSIGLHELGVDGVFLKPVDDALVVRTLQNRLATRAVVAAGA